MLQVIRAPVVEEDLLEIWDYIAQDDMDAADRVLDRIDEAIGNIARSPGLGVARDDLAEGIRAFPVGVYMIFYRAGEDRIEIVRVLSGVRKLTRFF